MNIKSTYWKTLLIAVIAILGGNAAIAANKLYIEPFVIRSADVQPVNVLFEFDEDFVGLSADFVLPDGLSIVGQPTRNHNVFESDQTLSFNPSNNRILVVSGSSKPLRARKGTLCTINVKATQALVNAGGSVPFGINNIVFSKMNGGVAEGVKVENFTTRLTVQSAVINATSSTPELVINPGVATEVRVGMDNSVAATGASLNIVLPEGFTVEPEDMSLFHLTGRASIGAVVTPYPLKEGNGYRLVIANFNGQNAITGNSGDFLTFKVAVPADYTAESGEIKVTNLMISDQGGRSYSGEGCTINFINGVTALNKANAEVKSLEDALAAALEKIATEAPDVKDQFPGTEISEAINSLKEAISNSYDNKTLTADYDKVMAPAAGIRAAIDKLVSDALAAEDDFKAETARQEAYATANAALEELNKAFQDALATIAEEAKDVKDQFKGTEIAAEIKDLKSAIDRAYEDKSIAANLTSLLAPAEGIKAEIEKLVADAKAAQKAYEEEQAAKAALEKAYADANAEVKSLRDAFESALKEIETAAPDVKNNFKGLEISQAITNLESDITKAYNNKTLTADYETVMAPATEIRDAIAKLVADATAAQKAYEEEQAAKAALEKAYADANAEVKSLRDAFEKARKEIEIAAPDVKNNFKGLEISQAITNLENEVVKAYNNKTLAGDYETVMAPATEIRDAIAKLVADATAAQKAYEEEQAAAQANLEAYNKAKARIEQLRESYKGAQDEIAALAPDVKDNFKGAEILSAINTLKSNVDNAYNEKTLVANYETVMAPVADIEAAIAKLVADAKAAQDIFKADKANSEALVKANAEIAALNKKLEAALAEIATAAPDVKNQFTGEAVLTQISVLNDAVTKAFTDKTLVADYDNIMAAVPSIEEAIAKLVADAKAAQKAYEEQVAADKALADALANANAVVADLNKTLNDAIATISEEAADVKGDFTADAILGKIAALEDAIKKATEDKTLVDSYEETVTDPAEEIQAAIAKLVEDAKAAQKAYEEQVAAEKALAEAVTNANAVVADLNKTLDEALSTISEEASDVKSEFTGDAILVKIAALEDAIKKATEDKTLVDSYEETVTDPAEELKAAIAKLVEDAKAAQKEYDRQKANDAAYDADMETIDALQEMLDDAKKAIEKNYPDFDMSGYVDDIQEAIDYEREKAENEHDSVKNGGTYENTVNEDLIKNLISELMAEAEKSTGVFSVFGDEDEIEGVFNMQGVRLAQPAHGEVNVIVYKNGKTKRIFLR